MNYNCILDLTLEQLQGLPYFENVDVEVTSIVIVPSEKKHHATGFQCMDFVLCDGFDVIGKIGGMADAINIVFKERDMYRMDCLPKSKCMRIFCNKPIDVPKYILSDFDLQTK